MPKPALWNAIKNALEVDIAEGVYPQGSKLPTEAQLAARFGVNRHTVRRALSALAEAGLVFSRRGAGVFVQHHITRYPIGERVRFHQNLKADGKLPSKRVLSVETRRASTREARVLMLDAEEFVHVYDGLSSADDQPIAAFVSVFPASMLPDLPRFLALQGSVTEALKQCGVADYMRTSTQLTARPAPATTANLLQIRNGAPVIYVESVNSLTDGQPVEFGQTYFAGDRVTLGIGEAIS